jgi:chitin disaccharide deacetylase
LRYLITNADDFGFTSDVNEGIVHAHQKGILSATTLMATGAAFDHAVALARENPLLDVGVHLVLVGSPGFPPTTGALVRAVALRRIPIYEELSRQVRKILDAGIRPTHLDTHKHTHVLPQVLSAVARISKEFQIPWVRRPLVPGLLGMLTRRGCRVTDHFAGYRMTGKFDSTSLANFIRHLPKGSTEFMCHPGFCTSELLGARTRLKESRRQELEALTSSRVRYALEESNIALVRYRDL